MDKGRWGGVVVGGGHRGSELVRANSWCLLTKVSPTVKMDLKTHPH